MARQHEAGDGSDRQQEYWSDYYRRNKDRIRARRQQKYQEDPAYREATLARSRRFYWLTVRPERVHQHEARLPALAEMTPAVTFQLKVTAPVAGWVGTVVAVRGYATHHVAALLGRSQQTIRRWERSGVLPEPSHRARDVGSGLMRGNNPRIYTEDEMQVLEAARGFLSLPMGRPSESVFARQVHGAWGRLVHGLALVGEPARRGEVAPPGSAPSRREDDRAVHFVSGTFLVTGTVSCVAHGSEEETRRALLQGDVPGSAIHVVAITGLQGAGGSDGH